MVMHLRGYRPADAPAVAALLNLAEERAGGRSTVAPAELDAMVRGLVREPSEQTRLAFLDDGTLVAAGLNIAPPPGGFRFDAMGAVHPDFCGRGLGRDLFDWQLRQASRLHDASGAGQPWQIRVRTIAGHMPATRLYGRFGLEPVRHWYAMTARIGSPDAGPLPDGVRVAEYEAADEAGVYALHMQAFTDHWRYQIREQDQWAAITVRSPLFVPSLSLLARDAGGLAGYVLAYHGIDPERLILGQCGVRRNWRRRGLARSLVRQVLARAFGAGKRFAGLVTDAANPSGAVSVGLHTGFVIETRGVTYAAEVGRADVTGPRTHSPCSARPNIPPPAPRRRGIPRSGRG